MATIGLDKVSKRYGKTEVIHGVDVDAWTAGPVPAAADEAAREGS